MKIDKATLVSDFTGRIKMYCERKEIVNIDILDEEWEIFFETLYEALELKGMVDNYYSVIWSIISDALNKPISSLNNWYPLYVIQNNKIIVTPYRTNQVITMNRLLESLDILKKYNFRKSEIAVLYNTIMNKYNLGEVIDIKELRKKR